MMMLIKLFYGKPMLTKVIIRLIQLSRILLIHQQNSRIVNTHIHIPVGTK